MLWCTVSAEEQKEIRITHGPWLCDVDTHGVTIMWVTDRPALSWVEVAPDDGRHFYSDAHPRHYDAAHGRRRALETLHRVRVEGLNRVPATCTGSSRRQPTDGRTATTRISERRSPPASTSASRCASPRWIRTPNGLNSLYSTTSTEIRMSCGSSAARSTSRSTTSWC